MIEYNFDSTPINKIIVDDKNNYYIKRDDLIPYSFGGNKVRIAFEFVKDMLEKKCNCMIAYGSSKSNLCRVLANLCQKNKIDCYVISPLEENEKEYEETNNSKLVKKMVKEIFVCQKQDVAETIVKVKKLLIEKGYKPYYIYDRENEKIAFNAYIKAFNEIKEYEKKQKVFFDYIFLASGTGITQTGIILGALKNNDKQKRCIIGISNARKREKGFNIIDKNVKECVDINIDNSNIEYDFIDDYICGGYGLYNIDVVDTIKTMYIINGIPLDPTYTGKAFMGMKKYLKRKKIKNKNILFIHTGGTPLFFDNIQIFND